MAEISLLISRCLPYGSTHELKEGLKATCHFCLTVLVKHTTVLPPRVFPTREVFVCLALIHLYVT